MNKQNQESRSFQEIAQEDSQKTLKEYRLVPENFKILSDRLKRKRRIEVDRYKSLFEVIDFTKIADMIQLITEYGVVSTEKLAKASKSKNKKKFILLSLRRQFTDQYLQRYNLQEIDCSLDQLYPEAIGRRDGDGWYTIASNMILDESRRVELKINMHSRCLYFTDNIGERRSIDDFFRRDFIEFLMIAMCTSEIFNYQLVWSEKRLMQLIMQMLNDETFITTE